MTTNNHDLTTAQRLFVQSWHRIPCQNALQIVDKLHASWATRRRDLGLRVPAVTAVYGLSDIHADDQLALPVSYTSAVVHAYGPSAIEFAPRLSY